MGKENGKSNNGLVVTIVILLIALLGVIGYLVYDKVILKDDKTESAQNKTEENSINEEKTYQSISVSEIEKMMTNNWTIDLLNKQENNISDVKSFLEKEEYNDYLIFRTHNILSDEYADLSKENFLDKSKETFGYDLGLEFNNIYDPCTNEIGLKYNSSTEEYEYMDSAFQCGGDFLGEYHYWFFDILNITSDDKNVYTVTANQIWTDEMTDFEPSNNYYDSYKDAKNKANPILSLSESEYSEILEEASYSEYAFDKINKTSTYEYKIAKEDGIIKVLSYKKLN